MGSFITIAENEVKDDNCIREWYDHAPAVQNQFAGDDFGAQLFFVLKQIVLDSILSMHLLSIWSLLTYKTGLMSYWTAFAFHGVR